jgi:glutaminase
MQPLARATKTNQPAHASQSVPPLARFLEACHADIAADNSGAVADYIPELTKADPDHFGISLVTTDGYIYEAGDSGVAFTIQSISKAFVFALALETIGPARVEGAIGVEPSGDAFNSIRLRPDFRPFNPMVNAGAIACSALLYDAQGEGAFDYILANLSRFAGRKLGVDEAVFASERATGDRNRAIAYLLRNYGVVKGGVDEILDVYFRQCSILVTARDLAVMAATLANRGINPLTGDQVISPYAVSHTLSVMTSSGMYDYAGEWIYRVGIPAKSGVGGGIIATLPAQFGLGTYSPLLDSHGNSVRGLKTCEALSFRFDLHVLNRNGDVRTAIGAEYDIRATSSRRSRQPHEQDILDRHHPSCHVFELTGALAFGSAEYLSRRILEARDRAQFIILELGRVTTLSEAAVRLLADTFSETTAGGTTVILAGVGKQAGMSASLAALTDENPKLRKFLLLDEAIEWAEDQIVYRYGGYERLKLATTLREQALLAGLAQEELEMLAGLMKPQNYRAGQRIISAGEPASALFFLQSGMVSVKLPNGVRLATLAPGMVFGEMGLLLDEARTADVWADTTSQCLELPLDAYARLREEKPHVGERIIRNLAALLAKRLILSNAKVSLLTSH